MAKPERQQQVQDLLQGLRGIEPLKKLFWEELNYDRVNQPLSRRGWPEPATEALADDPVLFASGGDGGVFHVIYCRLTSKNLSRGLERPVVTQLLREHPYALFIFSDKSQTDWHFLNVKFDDQAERRQLYRRITVRPGAGLRTATERVQLLDLAEIHPELFGITPLAIQQRCDAAFDVETVTKDFFTEVANWYFWALKNAKFPKDAPKEADGHDHISIIRLITRLIFCWFVKEKGLIPDTLFDQQKLAAILTGFEPAKASAKQSVFYKAILQNLFFATLNTEMDKRAWRKDDANFMAHILYRHKTLFQKPGEALALFKDIPFLNGGLFECLDKREGTPEKPRDIRIDGFSDRSDSQPTVPDFLFFGAEREVDLSEEYGDKKSKSVPVRGLIHIFNRYNFTVEEDTPIDQEVALDPELSGKVFENLLAAYNPETGATARKQTGSFYTPREVVNYMVDESLIACLKTKLETAFPQSSPSPGREGRGEGGQSPIEKKLRQLFAYTDEPHQFTAPEVDALIAAIDSLKTLDPAVGSGAFPMGILHKLVFILGKLDSHNEKWKERQIQRVRNTIKEAEKTEDAARRDKMVSDLEEQIAGINEAFRLNELDYGRKLYLIENCIYGVDIQPIAVQIAKMRFFISLIVDQKIDDNQPNRGVLPLPNLETKFVSANTLIGIERPDTQGKLFSNPKVDKLKSDLLGIRHRLFTAKSSETKRNLREKDKAVREDLAREIQKSLAKASEDEISQTRLDLEKARKTFEVEQSKPVQWETQRLTNLFGEVEETRIDTGKDQRRHLQEQVKQLESKLLRATQRDADIDATARKLANWDPYDQNASAAFFDAEWMFGLKEGFDILIGNPPYIHGKSGHFTEAEKVYFKTYYATAEYQMDTYVLFTEKSVLLNSSEGVTALIMPNTWLSNTRLIQIRNFLLSRCDFITISRMPPDVFSQAVVDTVILIVKNTKDCSDAIPVNIFREGQCDLSVTLSRAAVKANDGAIFETNTDDTAKQILRKIEACSIEISKIAKINRGVHPYRTDGYGKSKFSNGCQTKRDYEERSYHSNQKVNSTYYPEVRGKHIHPFCLEKHEEFISWGDWLAEPRDFSFFEGERIYLRKIVGKTLFACSVEKKIVADQSVYIAVPFNQDYETKYILGILNSKLLAWFFRNKHNEFDTLFPQIKVTEFKKLPIARTTSQKPLVNLVDKILTAKVRDRAADTTTLERDLDQQVYTLYGLTPVEIKIVEAASPSKKFE
jgi:hypothetical protein